MHQDLTIDFGQLPYGKGKPPGFLNRQNWRAETILGSSRDMLKGKRVLDLACNNGRLAYACFAFGAKQVVGVEARSEMVEEGKHFLIECGNGASNVVDLHCSDAFEFLESVNKGDFDTILCCGFLYHTTRQVDFYRHVQRIAPDSVIIDTTVNKYYMHLSHAGLSRNPALFVYIEDPSEERNTVATDGIVFRPSPSFLEKMFDVIGYDHESIPFKDPRIQSWEGLHDYRQAGSRVAYRARRRK